MEDLHSYEYYEEKERQRRIDELESYEDVSEDEDVEMTKPDLSTSLNVLQKISVESSTFKGLPIDTMAAMKALAERHPNECIVMSGSGESWHNLGINFYSSSFQGGPYIQPPPMGFVNGFNECLKRCGKSRFIAFPLTIWFITSSGEQGGHANYMIYDCSENAIERFEPYGFLESISDEVDKTVRIFFESNIPKIKYYSPLDFCPVISLQAVEETQEVLFRPTRRLGDPKGFCVAWAAYYADLRLGNPNKSREKLIQEALETLKSQTAVFTDFIRNYAEDLVKYRNQGIKEMEMEIDSPGQFAFGATTAYTGDPDPILSRQLLFQALFDTTFSQSLTSEICRPIFENVKVLGKESASLSEVAIGILRTNYMGRSYRIPIALKMFILDETYQSESLEYEARIYSEANNLIRNLNTWNLVAGLAYGKCTALQLKDSGPAFVEIINRLVRRLKLPPGLLSDAQLFDIKLGILITEKAGPKTVHDFLTQGPPFASTLEVIFQILFALSNLHSAGITHNDNHVKNIFIEERSGGNITTNVFIHPDSRVSYVSNQFFPMIFDYDRSYNSKDRNPFLDQSGGCENLGECNEMNARRDTLIFLCSLYKYSNDLFKNMTPTEEQAIQKVFIDPIKPWAQEIDNIKSSTGTGWACRLSKAVERKAREARMAGAIITEIPAITSLLKDPIFNAIQRPQKNPIGRLIVPLGEIFVHNGMERSHYTNVLNRSFGRNIFPENVQPQLLPAPAPAPPQLLPPQEPLPAELPRSPPVLRRRPPGLPRAPEKYIPPLPTTRAKLPPRGYGRRKSPRVISRTRRASPIPDVPPPTAPGVPDIPEYFDLLKEAELRSGPEQIEEGSFIDI